MLCSRRDFMLSALVGVALLAGCATWTFSPIRSARFVSENGDYLYVDYGREEHESTFTAPSGVTLPFKTKLKVRVTAPDGRRQSGPTGGTPGTGTKLSSASFLPIRPAAPTV